MKVSIVAVVVHDFDYVFGRVLFKNKLGGKYFGLLIVELEVDEALAAVVINKDCSTLVVPLGKFAL